MNSAMTQAKIGRSIKKRAMRGLSKIDKGCKAGCQSDTHPNEWARAMTDRIIQWGQRPQVPHRWIALSA
jgi:hypothetical protein